MKVQNRIIRFGRNVVRPEVVVAPQQRAFTKLPSAYSVEWPTELLKAKWGIYVLGSTRKAMMKYARSEGMTIDEALRKLLGEDRL